MKTTILVTTIIISGLLSSCGGNNQNDSSHKSSAQVTVKADENIDNNEVNIQSKDARITAIKEMYTQAQTLSKDAKSIKCEKGKMIEQEKFYDDLPPRDFEQLAEYCQLADGYALYKAQFKGHEWQDDCIYYLKDGKLFFAFITFGGEACFGEYRLYYDENEKVIQVLVKAENCLDEDYPSPSDKISQEDKNSIIKEAADNYAKIKSILKH